MPALKRGITRRRDKTCSHAEALKSIKGSPPRLLNMAELHSVDCYRS